MAQDFDAIRKQFPTLDHWTYLDNAAKAPLPRCAEEAMRSYMADVWEGAGKRSFSSQEIERTRETLARLVGVGLCVLAELLWIFQGAFRV